MPATYGRSCPRYLPCDNTALKLAPMSAPPSAPAQAATAPQTAPGLGLDGGGTQTRWALADAGGQLLGEGSIAPISGLQLASASGRERLLQTLQQLAAQLRPFGTPGALYAGITGLAEPGSGRAMAGLMAQALGIAPGRTTCCSDIELAHRAAFEPGEGYLLYAGTGSIAAFVDAQGQLQRAGGRGAILGDEGGGYWIAREALAAVWRAEDEAPGRWQDSALARRLFERLGGSDWATSRAFVYGGERGAMGQLALAVAAAAQAGDSQALALLRRAGQELARLVLALVGRYGPRPVVASGRALLLHPALTESLQEQLVAEGVALSLQQLQPHQTAAQLAARFP